MSEAHGGLGEFPARSLHAESFGEVGLSVAAIGGAMGGAVGATALGAELGTALPLLWGTLGTMLGSALAAGGWLLIETAWTTLAARRAAPREPAAPVESAPALPQLTSVG